MTFAYPWVFLLILPALFFLWRRWRIWRRAGLAIASSAPAENLPASPLLRFAWLPRALRVLAIACLLIALARPQITRLESTLRREGIAIELLVDISSSMDMRMDDQNRSRSRLEVAKEVLRDFILGTENGLSGRPGDLIGLITFARYADTVSPLTHSHEAVVFLAEQLVINDRPNEDGTAYGDATALAAARLARLSERAERDHRTAPIASKVIVLLTDGENNCGKYLPQQAAALAKKWGIRIYTISLTDPPKSQFVRVEGGEMIEAARARSAAERGLEEMATSTGGVFRTAYDFDTLQGVYAEIDRLERSEMQSAVRKVPSERFQPFAVASLACLVAEFLLQAFRFRVVP